MRITLSLADYAALSPLLIVLLGALAVLLIETFAEKASRKISFLLTALTFVLASIAAFYAPASTSELLTPWLKFDQLAKVFTILFTLIGLGSAFLADAFFKRFQASTGEYYFLLLASVFGLILIGTAADFLTLFLGLETLSIALYILCGYMKKWELSHEAAMKYFFIGAIAAALLLYGIALVYGANGNTNFGLLLQGYHHISENTTHALFLSGVALITLGLCFKAAIVPFHLWAPDVYDGSPNPVTAFMAVGTKAGAFAAFVRIFADALPGFNIYWNETIAVLAAITLIYANLVALRQVQLRRFFAYSGISHAGFLLLPLAAGTADSIPALLFYLVVYAFATLGSFAVLAYLDNNSNGVMLDDLSGMFRKSPYLASFFALCLLTLGGIPPTAGFFAKLYLFKVTFEAGYYTLVVIALLTTILSAYYYLRIVSVMMRDAQSLVPLNRNFAAGAMVAVALVALITLIVFPNMEFLAVVR
jgi:NADH-quinone oxidoreductase subunit N